MVSLNADSRLPATRPADARGFGRRMIVALQVVMLCAAAIFFGLHFLHLNADFPNNSPWMDWSKYTDEGWYGDAAIRQVLFGHWYFQGDFNPAVALPVWPLLEYVVFRMTGVSAAAARALTLCVFGVTLAATWLLLRQKREPHPGSGPSLAAPIAILMLCASPFLYVFERMAILEPLLICLTLLAMLAASHLQPVRDAGRRDAQWRRLAPALALGLLLPAMVLTKTTAIFLVPAVAYMVWARAGYRLRAMFRLSVVPACLAIAVWVGYYALVVHPRYLEDYRYLFSANAYTGIALEPLHTVILNTITDGTWMGSVLYPLFFGVLLLALFWRPMLFTRPVVPALLLWTGGYFAFLAYHNNLQPRYYLVVAVPITLLVAIGLDEFSQPSASVSADQRSRGVTVIASILAAAAVLAVVIPDAMQTMDFVRHPEYSFRAAAQGIAKIVRADKEHPSLVLSISGSDLTLMTGLRSIDDDFGTLELGDRVKQYRPGWYAAWNELDDDKMDALTPLYHVERVAEFPSMDDPDRNLLILYRLDPADQVKPAPRKRRRTPKPLVTRLGQQPTTQQLVH